MLDDYLFSTARVPVWDAAHDGGVAGLTSSELVSVVDALESELAPESVDAVLSSLDQFGITAEHDPARVLDLSRTLVDVIPPGNFARPWILAGLARLAANVGETAVSDRLRTLAINDVLDAVEQADLIVEHAFAQYLRGQAIEAYGTLEKAVAVLEACDPSVDSDAAEMLTDVLLFQAGLADARGATPHALRRAHLALVASAEIDQIDERDVESRYVAAVATAHLAAMTGDDDLRSAALAIASDFRAQATQPPAPEHLAMELRTAWRAGHHLGVVAAIDAALADLDALTTGEDPYALCTSLGVTTMAGWARERDADFPVELPGRVALALASHVSMRYDTLVDGPPSSADLHPDRVALAAELATHVDHARRFAVDVQVIAAATAISDDFVSRHWSAHHGFDVPDDGLPDHAASVEHFESALAAAPHWMRAGVWHLEQAGDARFEYTRDRSGHFALASTAFRRAATGFGTDPSRAHEAGLATRAARRAHLAIDLDGRSLV